MILLFKEGAIVVQEITLYVPMIPSNCEDSLSHRALFKLRQQPSFWRMSEGVLLNTWANVHTLYLFFYSSICFLHIVGSHGHATQL